MVLWDFDLIIPLTKESSEEAYKYSTYSSVMIEDWTIDEPMKDENVLTKPFILTRSQEILFLIKSKNVFKTTSRKKLYFL